MNIKEALMIGDLKAGKVIAGNKGITREISSIEVMEVPEVLSWVTPGILVMTVFYSIKDDPNKQTNIVQTLIDKDASGIVIKLGRFINTIPDEMIELANKHAFPIITLPKNVSYINVLTPLYENLYEEKEKGKKGIHHPFYEFEKSNFPFLSDAIEKISEIADSPVYIEDSEGRLLYVSESFQSDGWRKSSSLFSKPDYPSFTEKLEEWKTEFLNQSYTVFKMQGFRDRIILPLISKDKVFAVVHIQNKDLKYKDISTSHMIKIGNKLSELFINEQLLLQKQRLDDMESMEQYLGELENMETNKVVTVVHFRAKWLDISNCSSLYLIDHSSIIRRKLNDVVKQFSICKTLIFEKQHNFYAFMYCNRQDYPSVVRKWHELINNYNGTNPDLLRVAISSDMNNAKSFESRVQSATKTMKIGCRVKPEETVYTDDKLGIYEILINLTSNEFVNKYTENVLFPLSQVESNDLMDTLEVYLNENGNVSKASEKLFVHRRTMTYRIQRIQELLNMDLNDSNNRFILRFCLKIKDLS
ncbi:PucR family transcriptional regulator [Virgibacillus necropolis]|uniref:PucR family transcriptional regulator n=1 Tax=Virgibacillus necropolis TaxID=163877 RepID=UPI00384B6A0E